MPDAQINMLCAVKGERMKRNECSQANKWRSCAALKAKNPFDHADLLWIAWGEGIPYPLKRMKEHFKVFNHDNL